MGDGKGDFKNIPTKLSGFHLDGEIRDMLEMKTPTGNILLIARNNNALQVLKILRR